MKYLMLCLLAALSLFSTGALRAETSNCINIASLPVTISAQGVYCLKQDLSTTVTTGQAINILANNVTIDCNGYKIGGLGAGLGTEAAGIAAFQKNNITIRNCNIRGFMFGVMLSHNAIPDPIRPMGHVVENNRIGQSTRLAILLAGDGSVVRGNTISGVGGNPYGENAIGIQVNFNTDVIDNTVDEVVDVSASPSQVYGIYSVSGTGNAIVNNRVRGIASAGGINGIVTSSDNLRASVRDNIVVAESGSGTGIYCVSDTVIATNNHSNGFTGGVANCASANSATNSVVL